MKSGSHFIVSSIEGSLIALCGEVFSPRQCSGAQVGTYGTICKECQDKVKEAWVTIK